MDDTLVIPQDLEGCQRLLHELLSAHVELSKTCESLRASQEKLQQENEELQLTIKHLCRQLYGRRSERFVEGSGQQHLDFGDEPRVCPTRRSSPPSPRRKAARCLRRSWYVAGLVASHAARSCRIIWNVVPNASNHNSQTVSGPRTVL